MKPGDKTFMFKRSPCPTYPDDNYTVILHGHEGMSMQDLAEMFEHFLKATGFPMDGKRVEIVEDGDE